MGLLWGSWTEGGVAAHAKRGDEEGQARGLLWGSCGAGAGWQPTGRERRRRNGKGTALEAAGLGAGRKPTGGEGREQGKRDRLLRNSWGCGRGGSPVDGRNKSSGKGIGCCGAAGLGPGREPTGGEEQEQGKMEMLLRGS